jgi:hypothetical protein
MFPLDYDPSINQAMVRYRQEQVRASFPRKITRWLAPEPRRVVPDVSATAIPRLTEAGHAGLAGSVVPAPRIPEREQKYVA